MKVRHEEVHPDTNPTLTRPFVPSPVRKMLAGLHREGLCIYPKQGIHFKEIYVNVSYVWNKDILTKVHIVVNLWQ